MKVLDDLISATKAHGKARADFWAEYGPRVKRAFQILEFIGSEGDPRVEFNNWDFEKWSSEEGCTITLMGDDPGEGQYDSEYWIHASDLIDDWDVWIKVKKAEVDKITKKKKAEVAKWRRYERDQEREQYEKLHKRFGKGKKS